MIRVPISATLISVFCHSCRFCCALYVYAVFSLNAAYVAVVCRIMREARCGVVVTNALFKVTHSLYCLSMIHTHTRTHAWHTCTQVHAHTVTDHQTRLIAALLCNTIMLTADIRPVLQYLVLYGYILSVVGAVIFFEASNALVSGTQVRPNTFACEGRVHPA